MKMRLLRLLIVDALALFSFIDFVAAAEEPQKLPTFNLIYAKTFFFNRGADFGDKPIKIRYDSAIYKPDITVRYLIDTTSVEMKDSTFELVLPLTAKLHSFFYDSREYAFKDLSEGIGKWYVQLIPGVVNIPKYCHPLFRPTLVDSSKAAKIIGSLKINFEEDIKALKDTINKLELRPDLFGADSDNIYYSLSQKSVWDKALINTLIPGGLSNWKESRFTVAIPVALFQLGALVVASIAENQAQKEKDIYLKYNYRSDLEKRNEAEDNFKTFRILSFAGFSTYGLSFGILYGKALVSLKKPSLEIHLNGARKPLNINMIKD
jgi:hypothetical protein